MNRWRVKTGDQAQVASAVRAAGRRPSKEGREERGADNQKAANGGPTGRV